METKINRTNITTHLIEYQLGMVGKKLVDTFDDDKWYFNWTMTKKQRAEFQAYAIPLLKKVFHFNSSKALNSFSWFISEFGLRLKG